MVKAVPWAEGDSTYRKGAKWWGRALPYEEGAGDDRRTVYGDWWTAKRIEQLSLWQGRVDKAIAELMADDAAQLHFATIPIMSARAMRETRAENDEGWSFVTWWQKTSALVIPTEADQAAIDAETARRIRARERLRNEVETWIEQNLRSRAAHMFKGHSSTWTDEQIAQAAARNPPLLLRLARAQFVPDPGDLVPLHQRDVPQVAMSASAT